MCQTTDGKGSIPKAHQLELEYEPNELEDLCGHHDEEVSGNCGRAIIREIKRTVGTWWFKEMTNFNQKTVAVSFFIYFAAMAPAITFGAVYAKSTNNYIGPVEMIAATAWCGILYALIGGQPMMINGGTGPVLAFTTVLFNISGSFDVPFLTLNAWCGLWVTVFLLLAAFVDLNKLMKHATRFTDEIFAGLIAFIFIVDALGNPLNPVGMAWYFWENHKSHDAFENTVSDYAHEATAFLSLILGLGTTTLAFKFRGIKGSRFLPSQSIRNIFFDFAIVFSIAFWTFVNSVMFPNIPVESLNVPDSFAPTFQCCDELCRMSWPNDCPEVAEPLGRRPWMVDLGDLNGKTWLPFFAIVPALLAFILVFLDDGITWHLINHPSNGLTHGEAYNWDTIIIALMIAVNSMLGLPWLVAATVRSITHVNALAERDPKTGSVTSVQETRLTHFFIHALVLCSIFILKALKVIPVPVLYGVFLFMGLASLPANQFFCRFTYFFMQPSRYPDNAYTKYVDSSRMHKYTLIQLVLFIALITFRSVKSVAIAFPIVIKICIPIRMYILPKIFTREELIFLDDEDAVINRVIEKIDMKYGNQDVEGYNKHLDGQVVVTLEDGDSPSQKVDVSKDSLVDC